MGWVPGVALLYPANMQRSRSELDLFPVQVHQFGEAQTVPVGILHVKEPTEFARAQSD
jgi:hypothetical protein